MLRTGGVAVALALLLAGCSSAPTTLGSTTATASSANTLTDAQYLQFAHGLSYFDTSKDADILAVGAFACKWFEPPVPADTSRWEKMIASSVKAGMDAREAGQFAVYAVSRFCPENMQYFPKA